MGGNMRPDGPWMSQDGANMCQDGVLGDSLEAFREPPGGILEASWSSLGVSWGGFGPSCPFLTPSGPTWPQLATKMNP
eukprot:5858369-Karenia_brevis.AAC.1